MEARGQTGGGDQLGRRSRGGDPAAIEQHDAIREPLGLLHVVRAVEDGGARPRQRRDRREDALAGLGIDADGGLVEQEDARLVQDAAGEVEPPAHAAGERRDGLSEAPLEADDLERTTDRRCGGAAGEAVHAREEPQVLRGGQSRIHRGLLRDEAEHTARGAGLGRQRMAADRGRPGVGREHGREDRQHRRLAGAVRTEEPDDLARADRERDARERHPAAVALDDAVDRDGSVHGDSIDAERTARP